VGAALRAGGRGDPWSLWCYLATAQTSRDAWMVLPSTAVPLRALPHSATSAVAGSIPSTAASPRSTEIRPERLEKPAAAPAGVQADRMIRQSLARRSPALRVRVRFAGEWLRLHRRQRWTIASSRSARHSISASPRSMRAGPACGRLGFATANRRAAESIGAHDAGSLSLARNASTMRCACSPRGVAYEPDPHHAADTGDQALAAGQGEVAGASLRSAKQIDPGNKRATEGCRGCEPRRRCCHCSRMRECRSRRDYARSVQDYSQALSLDPGNARAARARPAHASFGQDAYAKALRRVRRARRGRLEEARESSRRLAHASGRRRGSDGLQRVGAALSARDTRARASALPVSKPRNAGMTRSTNTTAALKIDTVAGLLPAGRARAVARMDLSSQIQALIDRPERLSTPAVRGEAESLVKRAAGADRAGGAALADPALQILLPTFDVTVGWSWSPTMPRRCRSSGSGPLGRSPSGKSS